MDARAWRTDSRRSSLGSRLRRSGGQRPRWFSAFNEADIEAVVKAFTEEKATKLGVIMNGARTLLTGVAVGPSMLSVFEILGLGTHDHAAAESDRVELAIH